MALSTTISVKRIQSFLLPQLWYDLDDWKTECLKLIADFRFARTRPDFKSPDAVSEWVDKLLMPVYDDEEKLLYDDTLSSSIEFTGKYGPLWGWVAVSRWCGARPQAILGLWDILMCCGGAHPDALSTRNGDGCTLTAFACLHKTIASTVLHQPFVFFGLHDLHNDDFCELCSLILRRDTSAEPDAVTMWSRMSHEQRCRDPRALAKHLAHAACASNHLFCTIWSFVLQEVQELFEPTDVLMSLRTPVKQAAEQSRLQAICDAICTLTVFGKSLWTLCATNPNSCVWNIMIGSYDVSPLAIRALLIHNESNNHDSEIVNPLCAAMLLITPKDYDNEADIRAAWLVPRLSVANVNRYHIDGSTPLMIAVQRDLPLTINALLERAPCDVDLLSLPKSSKVDNRTASEQIKVRPRDELLARVCKTLQARTASIASQWSDKQRVMNVMCEALASQESHRTFQFLPRELITLCASFLFSV